MPKARTAAENAASACNASSRARASEFERAALQALREGGFRLTSPRIQVIRVLGNSNRPLGANEIHSRIAKSGGKVDSVSVYRILSTLQSVGIVHRIGVVDAFYACGIQADQVHDTQHFVCESCGCVSEVGFPEAARTLVQDASGALNFQPHEVHVEVLGLCAHCQMN